jgi:AcrR family transcriptional regulator
LDGHAAISARTLAQRAGVPPSTLYNHFPSPDRVFLAAHEFALSQAQGWCAAQLDQLPELVPALAACRAADHILPVDALGPIMAALIDEWAQNQRQLAFAWRESFLLAHRDPSHRPVWRRWRRLWADFWDKVCQRFGIAQHGEWTSFFFEGEATLHMLPWRRIVDRGALDELCAGWVQWLNGSPAKEGAWRRYGREYAISSAPLLSAFDDTGKKIAAAAASVVEQHGMGKLTHRAVAAEANVSLGTVSARFRTSVDLVSAAFEMIYRRLAAPEEPVPGPSSHHGNEELMTATPRLPSRLSYRLAMEELMLAVPGITHCNRSHLNYAICVDDQAGECSTKWQGKGRASPWPTKQYFPIF